MVSPGLLDREALTKDFIELYRRHYPRLVRALELSGTATSGAEDIAQEAFARTLDRWRRVARGTNPPGYVYRVAFRLVRRGGRRESALIEELATPDLADEATTRLGVEAALRAMPPGRRRCAVLCLVVGASTREAARALGIAESTVRKQLERARADLVVALGDRGMGDEQGSP